MKDRIRILEPLAVPRDRPPWWQVMSCSGCDAPLFHSAYEDRAPTNGERVGCGNCGAVHWFNEGEWMLSGDPPVVVQKKVVP